MGFGTIVFASATLLTASLHLILPPVIQGPAPEEDYCFEDETCPEESSNNILLYLILSLSLLSIGFGQTAGFVTLILISLVFSFDDFWINFIVYTLGIPYLDDNVGNRDSPVYFCESITRVQKFISA